MSEKELYLSITEVCFRMSVEDPKPDLPTVLQEEFKKFVDGVGISAKLNSSAQERGRNYDQPHADI